MSKFEIITQPKQVQHIVEDLNGVPLQMILIPSGTFMMGAPETEKESDDWEKPQHEVRVERFLMGRYPITQGQWKAVADMPQVATELKSNPSTYKGDKRPVTDVSWHDAIEFCARLSVHTNRKYRLPSEAEWEYACRAGTTTPFHFGETISTDVANYYGGEIYGEGEKGEVRGETTEVDKFDAANQFGLSDLHGNVWEWCLDPWHDDYKGAPRNGSVWDDNNEQEDYYDHIVKNIEQILTDDRYHVLRGGSFLNYPRNCRSAYRSFNNARDNIGFRVVCVLPRTP
ncbi:MAG: formylglycine-generating enzyme family protein [Crocosphaera sp.]|nr:formylglycine-generating enzyme family protein [Crocosphaera sp.]